jgi:hypothetical protein
MFRESLLEPGISVTMKGSMKARIEEKSTYSQELNDGAVNLVWSGAGIERSHQTGEDPIA